MRFFASDFFHESSSPKPLKITLGSFQIDTKICEDIGKSRCKFATCVNYTRGKIETSINYTVGKYATRTDGARHVVDTAGKFATCVNDTGGGILILLPLFASGVNDTRGYWWQIYRGITADFNNAGAQLTAERDTWIHPRPCTAAADVIFVL
jgi:hypothetical protein